jgi:RNA polymerase sigma-70 factor, ECF subfamily
MERTAQHVPHEGETRALGNALIQINAARRVFLIFPRSFQVPPMQPAADPFRILYDAHQPRVRRMLARMVGPHDAEDLTQTVFEKAATALSSFRGEAQASTWLYRIAANVASDWLRGRAGREMRLTDSLPDGLNASARPAALVAAEIDEQPSPEERLAQKDVRECLRGEVAKLPDSLRTVFMLNALGGLSDEEIAQTLGISHANAKVRLHRARQAFRKIIAARCDFYQDELSCKPSSPDCCPPAAPAGTTGIQARPPM